MIKSITLIACAALIICHGGCVNPEGNIMDHYTDDDVSVMQKRSLNIVSFSDPKTEHQIFDAIGIDPTKLTNPTSGLLNMGYWKAWSVSMNYDIWLIGAVQHQSGTYHTIRWSKRVGSARKDYPPLE